MAAKVDHDLDLVPPSGIPPKGKLGASRNEMIWLFIAVILAVLFVSFWWRIF